MAPAKRRAACNIQLRSRLGDAQPIDQGLGLHEPLVPVAQPRQRRSHQGVERLAAVAALVALQPSGLAIAHDVPAAAVRTHAQALQAPFDQFANFITSVSSSQAIDELASLDAAQPLEGPDDPIQLSLAHRKPHSGQSGTSPCSQSGGRVAHGVSLSPLNANIALLLTAPAAPLSRPGRDPCAATRARAP